VLLKLGPIGSTPLVSDALCVSVRKGVSGLDFAVRLFHLALACETERAVALALQVALPSFLSLEWVEDFSVHLPSHFEILIYPSHCRSLYLRVSGGFQRAPLPAPGRRATVVFDQLEVFTRSGERLFTAGWLFDLQAKLNPSLSNGADDSSWLETTYLSERVRLGRGNKGSVCAPILSFIQMS